MRRSIVVVLLMSWLVALAACAGDTRSTASPAAVPSAASITPTAASAAPTAAETPATSPTEMPPESPPPSAAPAESASAPAIEQTAAVPAPPAWSYPIGLEGRQPGDGFWIRDGFQVENTWYNPGDWHTGDDWYALDGDTAGANVLAVAEGQVAYVGSNYPGRVVIVRHADDLWSMYGHLDPAVRVAEGQRVARGDLLGTVLRRGDDVPNHLHVELRTFLLSDSVNGPSPRYGFRCGPNCAPGPGYWPIAAPDLPVALGWRNPIHTIARRMFPASGQPIGTVVVASTPAAPSLTLWATIDDDGSPQQSLGEIALEPGARFDLLEQRVGPDDPQATGAQTYVLWYRVALPDGRSGWLAALTADATDTGSDGAPAGVRFNLVPVVP